MTKEKHIIVGDVHGCIDELIELTRQIGLRAQDTWIFAGDVVDKGPDSAGVVKFIRKMNDVVKKAYIVIGNHELNHKSYLRAVKAKAEFDQPIKIPERKISVIKPIQDKLSDDDREFLFSGPLYTHLDFCDSLVVHAGILPTTPEIPPWGSFSKLKHGDAAMIKLHATRGRFCTSQDEYTFSLKAKIAADVFETDVAGRDEISGRELSELDISHFTISRVKKRESGQFVSFREETDDDVFWANVYDNRFGHVFFGHQPFTLDRPAEFKHATGLDLGCVHGGSLAAVILEGSTKTYEIVKSFDQYTEPIMSNIPVKK